MKKENQKILDKFDKLWGSYDPSQSDVGLDVAIRKFIEEVLKEKDNQLKKACKNEREKIKDAIKSISTNDDPSREFIENTKDLIIAVINEIK